MTASGDEPTVAIIFVVYREYARLDSLLERQAAPPGLHLVVVDNTEEDAFRPDLHSKWRSMGVSVLRPETNLGYAGAGQHAVDSLPELRSAAWVVLANSDLQFDFGDLWSRLASRSLPEDLGVLAPRLVTTTGGELAQRHYVEAPSAARFLRLGRIYSQYYLAVLHRTLSDLTRGARTRGSRLDDSTQIFAPHGALMIFTRRYVSETAFLRFPTFLFCEEVFVGLECSKANLRCHYDASIVYSHAGHGSIGRIPSRRVVTFLRDSHLAAASALQASEHN